MPPTKAATASSLAASLVFGLLQSTQYSGQVLTGSYSHNSSETQGREGPAAPASHNCGSYLRSELPSQHFQAGWALVGCQSHLFETRLGWGQEIRSQEFR